EGDRRVALVGGPRRREPGARRPPVRSGRSVHGGHHRHRIRLRADRGGGPMTTRFLTGAFAPATDEVTAFDLPVTGRIPVELNGRYLRNGPNPLGLEDPEAYHLFVGEGMVHGVRLRDGRAEWYRNRWVRSRDVASRLGEEWPGDPDGADF